MKFFYRFCWYEICMSIVFKQLSGAQLWLQYPLSTVRHWSLGPIWTRVLSVWSVLWKALALGLSQTSVGKTPLGLCAEVRWPPMSGGRRRRSKTFLTPVQWPALPIPELNELVMPYCVFASSLFRRQTQQRIKTVLLCSLKWPSWWTP